MQKKSFGRVFENQKRQFFFKEKTGLEERLAFLMVFLFFQFLL